MTLAVYSAEQVADILGLHVRTVRGYVRNGRLPAVRVGKQYRIAERDLRAFTGMGSEEPATAGPQAHASTVVHIENVDRLTMDRITTHVTASAIGDGSRPGALDLHSTYDETGCRLTVFITGDPKSAAVVLDLIGEMTRKEQE
ncbi:helix-turn-helix domain-containing protein [Mycolicibacterium chubuense]|uniref:helix-turn-helix domain-containing protein n=1 Tax=Mycolicibacterium chubuense TaxID=1800 RepID=UPI00069F2C22|nr:helix-turn-helix domain-containing protein [Mycolicibacterium chubuense]